MIQNYELAALGGLAVLVLFFIINRVRAVMAWKNRLDHVPHDVKHLDSMAELNRDNLRRDIRDTDAEVRKTREDLIKQINHALGEERQHNAAVNKQLRQDVNAWRAELCVIIKEFRNTFEASGSVDAEHHQAIEKLKAALEDLRTNAAFHMGNIEGGVKETREDLTLLGEHLHVKFRNKYSTRELYQTLTEKQTR